MITIGCDIDGTLLDYVGEPRYDVINLVRSLESFGCKVYIWSGSGITYAESVCRRLGLHNQVIIKGSIKVDLAIDDMETELGKINLQVFDGHKYEIHECSNCAHQQNDSIGGPCTACGVTKSEWKSEKEK